MNSFHKKNFEVEINIPDHVLYANANKDALQRIMFNLISNAIAMAAMENI